MPRLIMICGPNGAGKSTTTHLSGLRDEMPVLDPDYIARSEKLTPVAAGKETSTRAKRFIHEGQSFAKESTLTSRFDFTLMQMAKRNGYQVELIYTGVTSATDALERVRQREACGGHGVPEEDVVRRYGRSLKNLGEALSIVDRAIIVDNSSAVDRTIAVIEKGRVSDLTNHLPQWLAKAVPELEKDGRRAVFPKQHEIEM